MTREISGNIPDLLFKYASNELGCVEIGLENNGNKSTEELNEQRVKTPKMMRSFCWKIVKDYKTSSVDFKIASFIISGASITSSIMAFKYGYIGLLYTSTRIKMATTIKEVPRFLLRVLGLTYNSAQTIKDTVQHLNRVSKENEDGDELNFPPSSGLARLNNKKKKFSAYC